MLQKTCNNKERVGNWEKKLSCFYLDVLIVSQQTSSKLCMGQICSPALYDLRISYSTKENYRCFFFFINNWGYILLILSSCTKNPCYPTCVENVWKILKTPFTLLKWNVQHSCTNICQLGTIQGLMPRLALILLQSPSNKSYLELTI